MARREPKPVQDPCQPRPWSSPQNVDQLAADPVGARRRRLQLHVSRETLVLPWDPRADPSSRTTRACAAALRAGLIRAVDDAERAGAIPGIVADGLREVARNLPDDQLVAAVMDAAKLFGQASGLLGPLGELLGGL